MPGMLNVTFLARNRINYIRREIVGECPRSVYNQAITNLTWHDAETSHDKLSIKRICRLLLTPRYIPNYMKTC